MKQIIALGGGGFSMEPDNPLLDEYILNQSDKERPKICLVPTASGDSEGYVARFYAAFERLHCEPSHLSLFRPPKRDLRAWILDKDIVYVGGGNTKNLLALWREWGVDKILYEAWQQGIVMAGLSAGSICWFEQGVTDSYGDGLEVIEGLGWLAGSHCPHYDGEEKRRPSYQKFINDHQLIAGVAADDGVALHYTDTTLAKVVSSRPDASAYHVSLNAEKSITPIFLGEKG
ncbi:Type 1 glutamine amidotransferase-like domain-containing protein [Geomicrobium sp. JSM 1781026]|uniref:Type 1 glutamine amidotransferase-like domain-containing protein n=1 Tax=Geomicrobium sp. JSM 1781026 TaxID=3344580 RepID=UPI0035BFD4AF